MKTVAERFLEKVDKNGPVPSHRPELGPCHLWTGCLSGGYGHFRVNDKIEKAGRVALWLSTGNWPEGCALHHCDNRPCVNPAHLYDGTKKNNADDRAARKPESYLTGERWRARLIERPDLHRGENNGRAKISEVDAWSLRDLFSRGTPVKALVEGFDLTRTAIWDILHGDRWPDAGGPIIPRRAHVNAEA
jgi:hypothetical protein